MFQRVDLRLSYLMAYLHRRLWGRKTSIALELMAVHKAHHVVRRDSRQFRTIRPTRLGDSHPSKTLQQHGDQHLHRESKWFPGSCLMEWLPGRRVRAAPNPRFSYKSYVQLNCYRSFWGSPPQALPSKLIIRSGVLKGTLAWKATPTGHCLNSNSTNNIVSLSALILWQCMVLLRKTTYFIKNDKFYIVNTSFF